jgi:hypothetical protein
LAQIGVAIRLGHPDVMGKALFEIQCVLLSVIAARVCG